jgi:hypothetical protein
MNGPILLAQILSRDHVGINLLFNLAEHLIRYENTEQVLLNCNIYWQSDIRVLIKQAVVFLHKATDIGSMVTQVQMNLGWVRGF